VTAATELVRNAVLVLVRDEGGRTVSRPLIRDRPDDGLTRTEPEPLAGIRAALALRSAAANAARDCVLVLYAREDGRTWAEIGQAVYGDSLPAPQRPAEAFAYFAMDLGSGPVFPWVCGTCGAMVLDRGPEAGSPADQELGHAAGCERLTETIREYEAAD